MSLYTVTEELGTAPYTYSVIKTYRHRTLVDGVFQYSGLVSTCYDVPAVSEVPSSPAVITTDPQYGWNSGARSVDALVGDCYTQFTVPEGVLGVVCGLAPTQVGTDPRDVPHAFYIYQEAGKALWRVTEGGVGITPPVEASALTDLFRIERRGATVSYFFNGKRLYVSAVATTAPLMVVACMYAAGDGVN